MQSIVDDLGYEWIWDGRRVYMVEAEEEVGEENGYPASSYDNAVKTLVDGGYLTLYKVCWKSILTEHRGEGEALLTKQQAEDMVLILNHENKSITEHWVEEG